YSLPSRSVIAIAAWWLIVLGVAVGVVALPASVGKLLPVILLGALALWTLASVGWSSSTEATLDEFNRTALYVGVLVLGLLPRNRPVREKVVDGLTLAVVGITLLALGSRLFPDLFPDRELA